MHVCNSLGLEYGETPHRATVVATAVVGRVEVTGVEVEVVRVGTIRVWTRGPIAPLVACVVQPIGVHVPGPANVHSAYRKQKLFYTHKRP